MLEVHGIVTNIQLHDIIILCVISYAEAIVLYECMVTFLVISSPAAHTWAAGDNTTFLGTM